MLNLLGLLFGFISFLSSIILLRIYDHYNIDVKVVV